MGRQIDICDDCKHSAYVDEGDVNWVRATERWYIDNVSPLTMRFSCKACVEKRKAN